MTDRNLFFNGIWWRQFLGNEQAVRFLEELWRRSGGGPVPDLNIDQVIEEITQIDQSTTGQGASLHQARQLATQLVAEATETENQALRAQLKKLEHRISQLENDQ